jgi:phage antirepressor YoqD-like protein
VLHQSFTVGEAGNNVYRSVVGINIGSAIDAVRQGREAEKIVVTVPCGVAQFTRIVNEHISEDMKPLSATTVIKWLRNNGYLFEYKKDAKHRTNLPTEKGLQLGITVMKQQSIEGQDYQKVVYDISAQRFMLSNMESIAVIS